MSQAACVFISGNIKKLFKNWCAYIRPVPQPLSPTLSFTSTNWEISIKLLWREETKKHFQQIKNSSITFTAFGQNTCNWHSAVVEWGLIFNAGRNHKIHWCDTEREVNLLEPKLQSQSQNSRFHRPNLTLFFHNLLQLLVRRKIIIVKTAMLTLNNC